MSITMKDVANKAGVSKATVSRIINGIPNAATEETIEKVNNAIEELGYVPNFLAASLKKPFSKTVGLIVGDIENPFFGRVITGIERTLQSKGLSLILANSSYDYSKEKEIIQVFLERKVDAIIIAPCERSKKSLSNINRVINRGTHIILIDNYLPEINIDYVVVDNFDASYRGTKYLIETGHKKLSMITGPKFRTTSANRTKGFLTAIEEADLDIPDIFIQEGDYSIHSGYERMHTLFSTDLSPTSVFIANNLMTVGALQASSEIGLNIPKDVSILGFDDMDWYTITKPTLSAIKQPAQNMGKVAAERVIKYIKNKTKPKPKSFELKTELIVRDSIAPPP